MLYLELNCLPIRYIIKSRRVNFLSCILREDEDALIYKFLHAQLRKPNKNDWGQTVLADLEDLDISTPLSEIPRIPRESFKNLVSEKISVLALDYLNTEK